MIIGTREPRIQLQHIPFPGSIVAPPYLIRGLNVKDVDEMIDQKMVYKPEELYTLYITTSR